MAHRRLLIGAIVVSALLFIRGAHAQKTTGGIEGTITDPSEAVVPNAHVSATDETSGEKLTTISDQTGFYRFLEVHPDPYDAPANLRNGTLSGQPGTMSGTVPSNRTNIRQRGSGTFEQGARRQMQAGLRISF